MSSGWHFHSIYKRASRELTSNKAHTFAVIFAEGSQQMCMQHAVECTSVGCLQSVFAKTVAKTQFLENEWDGV
jgi:hypothetical protein